MIRLGRTSRLAYRELEGQGMPIPPHPRDDMPDMPEDITELEDRDLMALYGKGVAWCNYLSVQLAAALTDEKDASSRVVAEEARVFVEESAKSKVTVARTAVKTDASEELSHFRDRLKDKEAYRRLVEALYSSMERNVQLVSRELTRRTSSHRRDGYIP